ncbi:hypothetical protein NDU88_004385 [Pleurodeles waltl]|uniref:Uncharacterized protein n=1 Tax=Pleurodeles waltl TaxID=8319 RepID=A0AAV7RI49_PLEWA|nr:hypothetical protein NDU88_004385 [Pleurodeles waltl]
METATKGSETVTRNVSFFKQFTAATQPGENSQGNVTPGEPNDQDAAQLCSGTPILEKHPTAATTVTDLREASRSLHPEPPNTDREPRQPARRSGGGRYHLRQNPNSSRRYADFSVD